MPASPVKNTIVIPAKNEERTIEEIVKKCLRYANEVIVMDGHSVDKTRDIAESLGAKVILDDGRGKGSAMRKSVGQVSGDIIVFIDADGSHDPDDIPKLMAPILRGEADHVSGSRLLGGSSELHGTFDECLRLMGSSFITACINKRFGVVLSESQNGFRAIKTEVFKQLGLKENITTIEQEMIIKTLRRGFRMAEVPAHEYKRKYGKSSIRLSKVWLRYVYTLFKFLFFLRKGDNFLQ